MRALVVAVIITAAVAPARAQQAPGIAEAKVKAREAYRTASQHYDLGEFADALRDFKEAYRNYEEPTFLFNIGQCHRQLGQKEQAIRFFKVYLSKVPNASNKADVKDMIGKLEVALDQERAAQTGRPMGTMEPPEKNDGKTDGGKPEKPVEPGKPEPATVAAPVDTTPALVVTGGSPAETPVYKKWWLWTAVAAVVVVGVGIGLGVGLSSSSGSTPSAKTDFGTYKPF